jgi:thiol-disulfide isomerase/thioredoxin
MFIYKMSFYLKMKKLITILLSLSTLMSVAQTATDFTVSDCDGNSYNLFSDLDAGKIVIITWTMPCGACVSGALTAYNIAQSYEATHPGKVKMLLADDFGNTPCSSIVAWGNSNGITRSIKFSDPAIQMNDYGVAGMPKTVAIAPDHSVIFNQNNEVNPDSLVAAIDAALSITTTEEAPVNISTMSVIPNPISDAGTLKVNLLKNATLTVNVYDMTGKWVRNIYEGTCLQGENLIPLDFAGLNNGLFQLQLTEGTNTTGLMFLVKH